MQVISLIDEQSLNKEPQKKPKKKLTTQIPTGHNVGWSGTNELVACYDQSLTVVELKRRAVF